MTRESLEQLLERARVRDVPEEQLTGYADEVRRRLDAPPSTVVRVRPQLGWWARFLVPAGVAVMAALLAVHMSQPVTPLQLAEAPLEDEAAILSILSPEEPLLSEDESALIDEMDLLEELEPSANGAGNLRVIAT